MLALSIITLCAPALLVVPAASAVTSNAPHSSNPYGQLSIWEGRWNYSGQTFDTPYSHAHQSYTGTSIRFFRPTDKRIVPRFPPITAGIGS
jgi:hypothetical protein